MPHQCTTCGRTFDDGSKEMLSGCPDCGGNKFQFKPGRVADGNAGEGAGSGPATASKKTPDAASSPAENARQSAGDAHETGGEDRASAVDRAAATVRDWVGAGSDADDSAGRDPSPSTRTGRASTSGAADATRSADSAPTAEDTAQASARRDVVSKSELPDEAPRSSLSAGPTAEPSEEANVVNAPDDENPGLEELREELNSQFESIRIVEPGQYELNLMELYEREEYIISLQEDGKYVIEVPDAWDAVDR